MRIIERLTQKQMGRFRDGSPGQELADKIILFATDWEKRPDGVACS